MSDSWYFLKIDGKITKFAFSSATNDKDSDWKNIPAEQFLSINEIAEHQLATMHVDDKKFMAVQKKEELIGMHFGYGMWLRNSYGLWHPNNPMIIPNDLGDGHPDGLSMLVIEEIHTRLTTFVPGRTNSDAFQDAMSIVQEK